MQNRRDFLKTTALAVAGVAVAGCKTGSPQPFNIVKGDGKLHLKFFPYELKLAHVFTVASYSRTTTPDVQVELEWEGVTGYGEASHDLVGKLLGQPWYKLWGLDPAKAPSTTFTIGIDTPEVVKEKTLEAVGKFNILKVKVGLDTDVQMIETIRTVTDVPLAVDANQGWKDRSKALDEIFWLKEHGIVMVEQPMAKERIDDIAWLTERSPLPIFADESIQRMKDIPSLVGAYNGINIKLMKCTGMREGWRMATMARALGMKVMVGCMTETSCAVSAAAQFSPYVDFADLDGNLLIANDRFDGVKVVGGKLSLPDRPGIGVVPLA